MLYVLLAALVVSGTGVWQQTELQKKVQEKERHAVHAPKTKPAALTIKVIPKPKVNPQQQAMLDGIEVMDLSGSRHA